MPEDLKPLRNPWQAVTGAQFEFIALSRIHEHPARQHGTSGSRDVEFWGFWV